MDGMDNLKKAGAVFSARLSRILAFKEKPIFNIDPNALVIRGNEPMEIKSQTMPTETSAGTLMVCEVAEMILAIETTVTRQDKIRHDKTRQDKTSEWLLSA
jgi:hypothetical protein